MSPSKAGVMRFELPNGGLLEWIGRIISYGSADSSESGHTPRGLIILLLAIACWLLAAGLIWLAIVGLQAL